MTTTTRFRHVDSDDIIYVGTVEITEDTAEFGEPTIDFTILDCWRYGTTIEEVFPYAKGFPANIRREIIQTAFEQRQTPPATPVELPTDWEEIEVLDVEMNYTICIKSVLPEVKTDVEAKAYGLSAVKRVRSMNAGKQYQVTAKGGFDDIRRELHRIRIF